ELQESLLPERSALIDREDVTVLAVGVYNAVAIYAECVHAPLEAVWMIINAGDRAVRLASATERVCVLELPFYPEIGIELSDEELFRVVRRCGRAIRRANFGIAAVRANRIMIVFGDYRVCSIVAENRRSDIPAEQVGREELACRTELHQMPLSVVVRGVSSENDASIRKDNRRRGSVIKHTAGRRLIRIGGNPRVRALPTTARFPIGRNQNIAAVIQVIAQ